MSKNQQIYQAKCSHGIKHTQPKIRSNLIQIKPLREEKKKKQKTINITSRHIKNKLARWRPGVPTLNFKKCPSITQPNPKNVYLKNKNKNYIDIGHEN